VGAAASAVMAAQVPLVPPVRAAEHAMHVPVHAELQQTPFAQNPVPHVVPVLHAAPLELPLEEPLLLPLEPPLFDPLLEPLELPLDEPLLPELPLEEPLPDPLVLPLPDPELPPLLEPLVLPLPDPLPLPEPPLPLEPLLDAEPALPLELELALEPELLLAPPSDPPPSVLRNTAGCAEHATTRPHPSALTRIQRGIRRLLPPAQKPFVTPRFNPNVA
jgi:hypothetical protein